MHRAPNRARALATTRAAAVAAVAATTLVVGPTSATAASATAVPSPTPATTTVTVTVDQARLDALCSDRWPELRERAERLLERIEAGSGTQGSVAWLRDRADRLEQNGHPDRSAVLRARADARTARAESIRDALARLDPLAAEVCPQVQP